MAQLMRDTQTPYSSIGAPTPSRVVEAMGIDLHQRIFDVPEELSTLFLGEASKVLEQFPAEAALARAMASMSGMKAIPKTRSLLSMRPGFVTLRLCDPSARQLFPGVGAFLAWLRRRTGAPTVDAIGRVNLARADAGEVVLFDVPEEMAGAVLALDLAEEGLQVTLLPGPLGRHREPRGGARAWRARRARGPRQEGRQAKGVLRGPLGSPRWRLPRWRLPRRRVPRGWRPRVGPGRGWPGRRARVGADVPRRGRELVGWRLGEVEQPRGRPPERRVGGLGGGQWRRGGGRRAPAPAEPPACPVPGRGRRRRVGCTRG